MEQPAQRFPRWNLHADAQQAAAVEARAVQALADLLAAPDTARLAAVCDTRALHALLFSSVAPADLPEAAGTYRGTTGSRLEHARRAVFVARRLPGLRQRDLCAPPDAVLPRMAALADRVTAHWQAPPAEPLAALAEFLGDFLRIHPYLDGNGHVCRLAAVVLGRHMGLRETPGWTIGRRPYDHHMSLCLQLYPDFPDLLPAYLGRWFR